MLTTICILNIYYETNPILFNLVLYLLAGATTSGHPGSGKVVDRNGRVYFTDTDKGIWKIDAQGKLTFITASKLPQTQQRFV